MIDDHSSLAIIYAAIEQHNATAPKDSQLEPSPDTVLFCSEGVLDSLQFVSLVLEIEETVPDKYQVEINIADEHALTQTPSPFRTLGSLAAHIAVLLQEGADG